MNTSLFKKRYTVGTLEYSFWQMMKIFFWMILPAAAECRQQVFCACSSGNAV